MRLRRRIDGGYEVVDCPLPALITVMGESNEPRAASAKGIMRYKGCKTRLDAEREAMVELGGKRDDKDVLSDTDRRVGELEDNGWLMPVWVLEDIDAKVERTGLSGSATKVKETESVVLKGGEVKHIEATKEGIGAMVHELIKDHTLG
jgi:electron transfer flavoprotein beta subunit